jgi:hypothetical protein
MATDDDLDILSGSVPEPDAEPTAAERTYARTFADLIDKTLAGRTPPAMSAEDRALLEVATVIRAASGKVALPAPRQHALIEDALRQSVGGAGAASAASGGVVPIARARARRWVPWTIAGASVLVAAAAVLLVWLRAPERAPATAAADPAVPVSWTSRPTDSLIGPISAERAGDASTRIDAIFADRLDGYRERRLARGRKP